MSNLSEFDTIWPADSLEFCPHPVAHNIFVCGTYYLEPSNSNSDVAPQHRRGKCLVFTHDFDDQGGLPVLRQIQEISLPAVPDMKWCHRAENTSPLLCIADSEGRITLHEWGFSQKSLVQTDSVSCATADVLCLSLDWSNRRFPTSSLGLLTVSLSNGSLCLVAPDSTGGLSLAHQWPAHDYESWIAAWNYWDTSIIFSGGDDMKFKAWDIRRGFSQPIWTNKRFEGGVTTIQSHPYVEHLIAVGSYDDTLRLFDTRKVTIPVAQAAVGGGVWRVKWHPSPKRINDILVACMHDGFKVVQFSEPSANDGAPRSGPRTIKRFDEHASLAYGVDWSYEPTTYESLIGSCSFYDHKLHLWSG